MKLVNINKLLDTIKIDILAITILVQQQLSHPRKSQELNI